MKNHARDGVIPPESMPVGSSHVDGHFGVDMLPYIPQGQQQRSGLLIDYLCLRGHQQNEDYLDLLILGERKYGVLLLNLPADVLHNQERISALKRRLRDQFGDVPPSLTLRALEGLIADEVPSYTLHAAYAIFNQQTQTLTFATTSKAPIFLYRPARKQIYRLVSEDSAVYGSTLDEGPADAAFRKPVATLRSETVRLHQHDLVLFFSEGFYRLRNTWGAAFGLQQIKDFVREHGNRQPTPLVEAWQRQLEEFTMGEPPACQVTIVAAKTMQAESNASYDESAMEIEDRFLTIDEEQELWKTTDEYPEMRLRELVNILGRRFVRLGPERIRLYLRNDFRVPVNGEVAASSEPVRPAMETLEHQDLLESFPIRQLLYRKYEFRGNTEAIKKALDLYQNGHFQESLIEFMKVRHAIADSESVYCFFGNLYLLLNMSIKARQEYVKALRLNPRCVPAYLGLAYISLLHKDYEGTISYLTTAIRLDSRLQSYERFLQRLVSQLEERNGHHEWLS